MAASGSPLARRSEDVCTSRAGRGSLREAVALSGDQTEVSEECPGCFGAKLYRTSQSRGEADTWHTRVSGSVDGAMIYDSAGGEPLAVRMQSGHTKWTRYTLFRRVPASGTIHVTLALTGMGKVYFDDVSIEPLRSTTSAMAPRPAPEKSRR